MIPISLFALLGLVAVALCAWVVLEWLAVSSGLAGELRSWVRRQRCRRRGSKLVPLPEDLRLAADNGLLAVGSELVVGWQAEWEGATVRRYAIAPETAGEPAGTILQVLELDRRWIELRVAPGREGGHSCPPWALPGGGQECPPSVVPLSRPWS